MIYFLNPVMLLHQGHFIHEILLDTKEDSSPQVCDVDAGLVLWAGAAGVDSAPWTAPALL